MKKKILSLVILSFIIIKAYPQNFISQSIRGKAGISLQFTPADEKRPIAFNVSQVKSLLDLHQNSELVLQRTEQDKLGFIHYRYYQTYKSIPVENTMYIIHTKNGLLKSLGGTIVTDFDSHMQERSAQKISNTQAVHIAIKYVAAKLYAWEDVSMEQRIKEQTKNSKATYLPKAVLVWYSPTDEVSPRALRLCYKVDVYARQPLSRAYYFVDAITGNVLGKEDEIHYSDATGTANTAYSGARTIHSDFNGTNYRLRDLTKGSGIITLHGENATFGNNYTSSSANWTLTGTNIAALDAHYGVSQTYAFYYSNFGRDSYDDAGTALYSYVNEPTYLDNAFWDGSAMYFNKRSNGSPGGVTGIDVTGHELTHGVTQETSGLNYSKEPGAINESISDIMGKSVQFWSKPGDINWVLSNDMNFLFRSMSNPNVYDQPDTYKGTHWEFTAFDNYGVHINSGVGNFMFYLLVNGGNGTNDNGDSYSVTGIGLSKADQIIYRSNVLYLTPTSKYANWRTACLNAASDLYGTGSTEVRQVENAWYAVGVGNPADSCDIAKGLKSTFITGTSQKLSWNAATGAKEYKLQYRLSSATTWTTISHILSNSYSLTSLLPNKNYKYKVQTVCSGGIKSAYSNSLSFSTSLNYCAISGGTTYEYINKVVMGSINNTSGDNNGYGDYTSLSTTCTAGNSVQIKLTPAFTDMLTYDEYWTVSIDYNQNGVFTDAGELVTSGHGTGTVTKTFTVPATAKNGPTRMRIIMQFETAFAGSCGSFTEGEAEDYTVNITGGSVTAIASANDAKTNNSNSIAITPNPVRTSAANLVLQAGKAAPVNIRITDLSGRVLISKQLNDVRIGKNTVVLNGLNNLVNGIYMVAAEQGGIIIGRTQLVVNR